MATDVPVPGIGTTASSVASPSGGGTRSSQGRPSCGPGGADSHDQASSCVSASPSPGGTEPIVHLSDRLCQETLALPARGPLEATTRPRAVTQLTGAVGTMRQGCGSSGVSD